MYRPAEMVIGYTEDVENDTFWHTRERLASNGTITRRPNGRLLKFKSKGEGVLCFFKYRGKFCGHRVSNKQLASRIIDYFENYFGKQFTNCSSFAHFLRTGAFQACCPDQYNIVNEQGFRQYEPGQKVKVGDILCIMYARESLLKSRKVGFYKEFRKSKKARNDTGEIVPGMQPKHGNICKEKLLELYKTTITTS